MDLVLERRSAPRHGKECSADRSHFMEAIYVAIIGTVGAVIVALIEKSRRENKSDHNVVSEKLDMLGKSLGRSIDRVEKGVERTEKKIDQHIADHARGEFSADVSEIEELADELSKKRGRRRGG